MEAQNDEGGTVENLRIIWYQDFWRQAKIVGF